MSKKVWCLPEELKASVEQRKDSFQGPRGDNQARGKIEQGRNGNEWIMTDGVLDSMLYVDL